MGCDVHFGRKQRHLDRRGFVRAIGCAGAGLALGGRGVFADQPGASSPKHITFEDGADRVFTAPCSNAPFGGAYYPSLQITAPGSGTQAIFDLDKVWDIGKVIHVLFLNGQGDPWTKRLQEQVRRLASSWSDYAHVTFQFHDQDPRDSSIDMSVNFVPFHDDRGNYFNNLFNCHLGKNCREYLPFTQSMNLVFHPSLKSYPEEYQNTEFRRLILHEFGHALGLIHEHQRPDRPINWNKPALYAWAKRLYRWEPKTVDEQIIKKYERSRLVGTAFDVRSIMMYQYTTEDGVPLAYYNDGTSFMTESNTRLTALDKVAAAITYPKPAKVIGEALLSPGEEPLKGAIQEAGQVARYRITAGAGGGEYMIETGGEMPTLLALLKEQNDPGGRGSSANILSAAQSLEGQAGARLSVRLAPNETRYIELRHIKPTHGTGNFTIAARQGA
jgi:hypothetical protein